MCKKKKQSPVMTKSVNEMSDTEFITYADYLSSPYYRAYINARTRADITQSGYASNYGYYGRPVREAPTEPLPKGKIYSKKRGLALFFILIAMLLTVAVAVVGYLGIDGISDYVAVYKVPGVTEEMDEAVSLVDPAIGLVDKIASVDGLNSVYFDNFANDKLDEADAMLKIALYAVPVAVIVLAVFTVVGLIKALAALFAGRKNGYYRKFKFGFISIVMLLCALVIAVGGVYAANIGIDGAADFLTFKSNVLQASFGLYAIVVLPIISFILSCVSYKKVKKPSKDRG